ncbi:hypothetical protein [Actinopolymorpha alba]|uniref:hypothetical protein n=1 Tax=Actinopolymorpha alba TaxID=533267 RepID=UPI00037B78CC|nr:hypothetical protein [Actinopolymorpha alba]
MYDGNPGGQQQPPDWSAFPGPHPPPRDRGAGPGMAVASLVMSIAALVGVIVIGVFVLFTDPYLVPPDEDYADVESAAPLRGMVPEPPTDGLIRGTDLTRVVTDLVEEDWDETATLRCPDTEKVNQGVVTLCHGTIGGDEWAVIVYFEDARGRFTLDFI